MPWSIDGPSADQLGYLRRRKQRETENRRSAGQASGWRGRLGPALFVVVLVLAALIVVLFLTSREPRIATEALGTWRELGSPEHYVLVLGSDGHGAYDISYPRTAADRALLSDDHLEIAPGQDSSGVVWVLTYDAESDRLTATSSHGVFSLERVP